MKRLFTSIFLLFVVIGTSVSSNLLANETTSKAFGLATITASSVGGGSINPYATIQVPLGSNQPYTIIADDCNVISDIKIDGASIAVTDPKSVTYTFTDIQADHMIHVVFTHVTHEISATSGPNGSITPSGDLTVNCAADQLFTFTPASGYKLDSLIVDGIVVYASEAAGTPVTPPPSSRQIANIRDNHTIRVVWRALYEFTITPSIRSGAAWGTINPSTQITVLEGESRTVEYTPNASAALYTCHVDSLFVDGNPVTFIRDGGIHTFYDVMRSHTIEVVFDTTETSIKYVDIPELGVYPNPTTGRLVIASGDFEISMIEITNTLGNVVMVIEYPSEMLDLSNLAKGTYFLRFTTSKGYAIRQVIRN